MASWFSNYFSSKTVFATLFGQVSDNLEEMSALLIEGFNMDEAADREMIFKRIDALEEKGDDCTHKIYLALEKIYFAPYNKKDIHVLASVMDDIADQIQEAASRVQLYDITVINPAMKQMAEYIAKSVIDIQTLIRLLYEKGTLPDMYDHCKRIKAYEHETDLIYYRALGDLFATEKSPVNLLKYRDILQSIESGANRCKNTADAIETILLSSI
jgi:predicted phosphate transport protein (TIGR00153 family)